jgi:hypothetical protein
MWTEKEKRSKRSLKLRDFEHKNLLTYSENTWKVRTGIMLIWRICQKNLAIFS